MHRLALAVIAALAFAACGSDEPTTPATGGGSDELASLVVTVDSDGDGAEAPKELEVSCKQPTDSDACGAAAGISAADLRPTADDVACTQQFGGPETATIKGAIRGEPVDASFARSDGCEISRWEKVAPLLDQVK
ncbi:hypothetical protein DVA67_021005 [Solirubrobacter sp. CPCC 204708]|uniref:Subtilisin inhibitor domain-containing protein n=1 Tax=Solirubrobacter deserti TaxID=2282478 RepID=A0ABT4REG5_9ACTN|nr:hypothetical protein [Solirubrobacter deserti]MBE2318474.1 hypothetical protein [Solirubrobacter deserti]MDA0136932.1 hypothetical protein [Solirubrobacter deserti]